MPKRLFVIFLLSLTSLLAVGQDSLRISWITCGQGEEAYSLYGHTALRVTNKEEGTDLVYNYGMFDFDTPHFVWRFCLGKTDYYLAAQPFDYFITAYSIIGRTVEEQELYLQPQEKLRLVSILDSLSTITNWTYRYNFLKDNCTTRAWKTLLQSINRVPVFSKPASQKTFRNILDECTTHSPWHRVGNNLVLGADVDTILSREAEFFSPFYARLWIDQCSLQDSTHQLTRLASPVQQLNTPKIIKEERHFPSPLLLLIMINACVLLMSIWEFLTQRNLWVLDLSLLTIHGMAGGIIAFLFFFSAHPSVNSNWNILWLNPLSILALPLFITPQMRKQRKGIYFYISYLILFISFFFITLLSIQNISIEILLLSTILLIRALTFLAFKVKN